MLLCYQSWQIGCVIATTIKRTAPLEGLSVYHFRGGVSRLQFGSLGTQRPENGGGIQGGETSPLGTRLLERSGKSLVCYTFCPGWRGKGDGRQDSRFAVPGKQAEEWSDSNHSSACFQEGQKVYTAPVPRPSSRRSEINVTTCAANRPVRPAPYSAPASPSDGSAPQSLG